MRVSYSLWSISFGAVVASPALTPLVTACDNDCSSDADCSGDCGICSGGKCDGYPPAPLAPPAPPSACGSDCISDDDCYGECYTCYGGQCWTPAPPPLAPPPTPPLPPSPSPSDSSACGIHCSVDAHCFGECGVCDGGVCLSYALPPFQPPSPPTPPPAPSACGSNCSSSEDCDDECNYCNGGTCTPSTPPPLAPPPIPPAPPPPSACGSNCSSNEDCYGDCDYCYPDASGAVVGICGATGPPPLAPPPPPPPPPPSACGSNCSSDQDCYGVCNFCDSGTCLSPAPPPPLAPPPPSACGAPCTVSSECWGGCNTCTGGTCKQARNVQRGGNATVTGCDGVEPASILRGISSRLLSHPEKLSDWEAISAQYGSSAVEVRIMEGAANKPPFPVRKLQMQEFLQATVLLSPEETKRTALYLQQLDLFSYLPGLAAAAGVPRDGAGALCEKLPKTRFAGYFVSAAGVTTPLHVDNGDVNARTLRKSSANFFVQISGTKRFVLIPPTVPLNYLHPSDGERWPHVSRAHEAVPGCQADEGAMSTWPGLADAWAQRIELTLGPGDGVLVPSWWWHCTEALEDGAAVNWWFDEEPVAVEVAVI